MKAQTTIKEALAKWEQKSGEKACDAKEIKICGCYPPIQKLDPTLSTLQNVEKLSLSTNGIDKIASLSQLSKYQNSRLIEDFFVSNDGTNVALYFIARPSENTLTESELHKIPGRIGVGDTLVELWISYNQIEKLKGINCMKKLEVLYMSNNYVKDWAEFNKMAELPRLENLLFTGNPLEEKHSLDGTWRKEVQKRLPNLKKLDGIPVTNDIEDEVSPIVIATSKEETPSDK